MKILLWGARSQGRLIARMIEDLFSRDTIVKGFFDATLETLPFKSPLKLYNSKDDLNKLIDSCSHFVTCIGGEHGLARFEISEQLRKKGLRPLSIISKYSIIDDAERIGEGIQMMPGAIIHKFSNVGEQCILNTNAVVDHECVIGNGVHVMGGASIAGRVEIGDFSTIGTNATILPDLKIGKNAYVGAGAVVTKDVNENQIVAGVPAKCVGKTNPEVNLSYFE